MVKRGNIFNLLVRNVQPTLCHSELGSESISKQTLNQVQGDRGKNIPSPRKMLMERGRYAFTLAEILITIGIIGVVSALTIPNLITNYQKRQTAEQLKKVYATIVNAVKLSEIDNDDMSGWNYPEGLSANRDWEIAAKFIKQYYQPYLKGSTLYKFSDLQASYGEDWNRLKNMPGVSNALVLADGTMLSFFFNYVQSSNGGYIWLFVDLNGAQRPNKVGRDIFVLEASPSKDYGGSKIIFFNYQDRNLIDGSDYSCNKNNTGIYRNYYCGRVIQKNNWKIPKDYPW
ncbi:type II secretion system protein [bacterium]|nr:type II secretion system protein [bacterium]